MKNLKIQALMLAFCICSIVLATGFADSSIGAVVTRPGSSGFKAVTTQNLTIATSSASLIGTMPPNCRTITVVAKDATMYYGDANVAANGLYPSIASGQSVTSITSTPAPRPSISSPWQLLPAKSASLPGNKE